jgi:hypothetical protein
MTLPLFLPPRLLAHKLAQPRVQQHSFAFVYRKIAKQAAINLFTNALRDTARVSRPGRACIRGMPATDEGRWRRRGQHQQQQ